MRKLIQKPILALGAALTVTVSNAQDTFSIVALDSATGEVGSAGASCVDLDLTLFTQDHFIGVLFPNQGSINTQASYLQSNQNNATARMNAGDTPDEIIDWLEANDANNTPEHRQYGVVAFVDGSPESAAYTGTSTLNYKGHILGPNYSIQGNILLGAEVLEAMQTAFLSEEGDLACKLMAAMQGANTVGADSRCASNNTSSLFAYLKVAQPEDDFGDPSLIVSVRTNNNDSIEPIDSLQTLFDAMHDCTIDTTDTTTSVSQIELEKRFFVYPNPAGSQITISRMKGTASEVEIQIIELTGKVVRSEKMRTGLVIDIKDLDSGVYVVRLVGDGFSSEQKFIKED